MRIKQIAYEASLNRPQFLIPASRFVAHPGRKRMAGDKGDHAALYAVPSLVFRVSGVYTCSCVPIPVHV